MFTNYQIEKLKKKLKEQGKTQNTLAKEVETTRQTISLIMRQKVTCGRVEERIKKLYEI